MYRALVIGCGNIGAGYDFENDHILTHAKAIYLHPGFELSIYDVDTTKSEIVSQKYNCNVANGVSIGELGLYDYVCICSPTNTHAAILKDAIAAGVKLIACEKPVSYSSDELEDIMNFYSGSNSKILVNYLRRFQPAYKELKSHIATIKASEKLTNISIRYQKGFINNCSHAFDLIEYLTESKIALSEICKHNIEYDYFENDPTISMSAKWGEIYFSAFGLTNVFYSFFEIDLFFEYHKISISDAGNVITIYKSEKGRKNLQALVKQDKYDGVNCVQDYMKYVTEESFNILCGNTTSTNFIESIELNHKMLNYLSI